MRDDGDIPPRGRTFTESPFETSERRHRSAVIAFPVRFGRAVGVRMRTRITVSFQTSRKDARLTPDRVSAVLKRSSVRAFNSAHRSDVEK
jgi:hypothetical protein